MRHSLVFRLQPSLLGLCCLAMAACSSVASQPPREPAVQPTPAATLPNAAEPAPKSAPSASEPKSGSVKPSSKTSATPRKPPPLPEGPAYGPEDDDYDGPSVPIRRVVKRADGTCVLVRDSGEVPVQCP